MQTGRGLEPDGGERHWLSPSTESLAKRLISLYYWRSVGMGQLVILRLGHLGFPKLSFSSFSITHTGAGGVAVCQGLAPLSEAGQREKLMKNRELWGSRTLLTWDMVHMSAPGG